jgi:hypothetical protein
MNIKTFLISGIVGGIVYFLFGWLFYGILFANYFPTDGKENLLFILLGCLTFGLFVSYIFNHWAQISTPFTGLRAGAFIGLFIGLYTNFFFNSMADEIKYQIMILDIVLTIALSGVVGITIAQLNGKLK